MYAALKECQRRPAITPPLLYPHEHSPVHVPPICMPPGYAASAASAEGEFTLAGPSMIMWPPGRPAFAYIRAKSAAGEEATKFVTGVLPSMREPPTICFTTPSCKSMQGRKRMETDVDIDQDACFENLTLSLNVFQENRIEKMLRLCQCYKCNDIVVFKKRNSQNYSTARATGEKVVYRA